MRHETFWEDHQLDGSHLKCESAMQMANSADATERTGDNGNGLLTAINGVSPF